MELNEVLAHIAAECTGSLEVLRTSDRSGTRISARGALGEIDVLLPSRFRAPAARLSRTTSGEFVSAPLSASDKQEGLELPASLKFSPLPDAAFLFQALDPSTPAEADVLCFSGSQVWASSLTVAHVVDLPARFRAPSVPMALPADVLRIIASFDGLSDVEVAFDSTSDEHRVYVRASSADGGVLGWFSSLSASPALMLQLTPTPNQSRFSVDVLSASSSPVTAFEIAPSSQLSLLPEPSPRGVCVSSAMLRRTLKLIGSQTVLVGASSPRNPVVLRSRSRAVVLAPLLLA